MPSYHITASESSTPFGLYEGSTPEDALRALYDDAGEEYPGDDVAREKWSVDLEANWRLSELLAGSGLSMVAFARDVLARDERTVRRWMSCEIDIPESVAQWLARVIAVELDADEVTVRVSRE